MKLYNIENARSIDWKKEVDCCWQKGIKIYAIQAHSIIQSYYFYQSLAARTCGTYLQLKQFSIVSDMLLMLCFRESDRIAFDNFRDEVEREGRMDLDRKNMFDCVSDSPSSITTSVSDTTPITTSA